MDKWIIFIERLIGSLSILGCLFIIIMFLCNKSLRSFAFETVIYLTLSSMMSTISYLIYLIDDPNQINWNACYVQSFLMVMFENCQYIWGTLIGYGVYQAVVADDLNESSTTNQSECKKRFRYLLVGFGVSLVITLILSFLNIFGPSGAWCWIDSTGSFRDQNKIKNTIFLVLIYCFYWILIIINIILTVKVVIFLNKNFNMKEERERIHRYIIKLLWYPMIQILCVFPGTINRFLSIFYDVDLYTLQVLHLYFMVSQGFIYAISYGFIPQVRLILTKNIKILFNCICCYKCDYRKDSDSSDLSERINEKSHNISNLSF